MRASRPRFAPRKLLIAPIIAVLLWSLIPVHGRAQPTAEPAEYQKLVDDAIEEYRARNFPEARSLFIRAHTLFPNARAARGLGMTEFELRNYGDCIAALERALASSVRPLEGTLRTETEALLARAESFVARIRIDAEPASTEVSLDGTMVTLPEDRVLMLSVGDHLLEFRASGHASERRAVKVKGGEEETLQIKLAKIESPSPSPIATAPLSSEPSERRPLYKNAWLWTGIGVAALAVGLGVGLTRGGTETLAPIAADPIATKKGP